MKYYFEIKEKAVGKSRPRYSAKFKRMYTPTKTSTFEEKIKNAFLEKYNIKLDPTERPIKMSITNIFAPPNSISKKKKNELLEKSYYTKKPDVDNIAKAILDALNKLAYKDDNQVCELNVIKQYGTENKIIVEIEEL